MKDRFKKYYKGKSRVEKIEFWIYCVQCSFLPFVVAENIYTWWIAKRLNIEEVICLILEVLFFMSIDMMMERIGILEQIKNQVFTTNKNNIYLSNRSEVWDKFLPELFDGVDKVQVASMTNAGVLCYDNYTMIKNAIRNGAKYEFVFIDPESETIQEMYKYKTSNNKGRIKDLDSALDFYENYIHINENLNSNVKCKFCNINLPYSLVIVYKKSGEIVVQIDLYGILSDNNDRRSFVIREDNKEHINYYLQQFKSIWEKSSFKPE